MGRDGKKWECVRVRMSNTNNEKISWNGKPLLFVVLLSWNGGDGDVEYVGSCVTSLDFILKCIVWIHMDCCYFLIYP